MQAGGGGWDVGGLRGEAIQRSATHKMLCDKVTQRQVALVQFTKRRKHVGAWSHEPFGNDTACDWSYGLLETEDLSSIESALDAVLDNDEDYLDADLASEAIAAIEVLAKLQGKGTQIDSYTHEIDQWVKQHPQQPSLSLLSKAKKVVERIQSEDSELLELWEEAEESDAWKASLQQLAAAIST